MEYFNVIKTFVRSGVSMIWYLWNTFHFMEICENFSTFTFLPSVGISHRMEILFPDQIC